MMGVNAFSGICEATRAPITAPINAKIAPGTVTDLSTFTLAKYVAADTVVPQIEPILLVATA